jgi:hypothetical protein
MPLVHPRAHDVVPSTPSLTERRAANTGSRPTRPSLPPSPRIPGAGVDPPWAFRDGEPVSFAVWDDADLSDFLVGGFVVDPDSRGEYTAKIHWDWNAPQSVSRPPVRACGGPVHTAAGGIG